MFSGNWAPEATLARLRPMGGITLGPAVDAGLRTADQKSYTAAKLLRSSRGCAREGRRAAEIIACDLERLT